MSGEGVDAQLPAKAVAPSPGAIRAVPIVAQPATARSVTSERVHAIHVSLGFKLLNGFLVTLIMVLMIHNLVVVGEVTGSSELLGGLVAYFAMILGLLYLTFAIFWPKHVIVRSGPAPSITLQMRWTSHTIMLTDRVRIKVICSPVCYFPLCQGVWFPRGLTTSFGRAVVVHSPDCCQSFIWSPADINGFLEHCAQLGTVHVDGWNDFGMPAV